MSVPSRGDYTIFDVLLKYSHIPVLLVVGASTCH